MSSSSRSWPILLLAFVALTSIVILVSGDAGTDRKILKSATFRSPPFTLKPGEVCNQLYFNVPFPKGHIGVKGFNAEVVDENGVSVPLSDVYLHHWVMVNYLQGNQNHATGKAPSVKVGNDGVCPHSALSQLFGLGSETRHTNTHISGPYAIDVGNYEDEAWRLNVHAIDTRGTLDPKGCLECRCSLYNVTVGEDGRPLRDDYKGGLLCCYDRTQCQLQKGYVGERKTYYLQYTVHYHDWDDGTLSLKVYIMDATYEGANCQIEYNVPACDGGSSDSDCVHTQESAMNMPVGGDVIYAVAHQHAGGLGAAIYGEDGREICTSWPVYGNGTEAGNEAGYIVGMSTCYPEPGSIQVLSGESLHLRSNYSAATSHTGVMGLAYILVYPTALPHY